MRYLIALLALCIATPVTAQPIAESYRNAAGQLQDGIGITNIAPIRSTSTPTNGTITTASTFQSALAANPSRKGCGLFNTSASAVLLVYLGAPGSAVVASSIPVGPGGGFNCGSFQGLVLTDQISVTSTTQGATFALVAQ